MATLSCHSSKTTSAIGIENSNFLDISSKNISTVSAFELYGY